jgi:signal transduction histidine kinase
LDSTLNVAWNEIKYKADVVREYAGVPELYCLPSQINQVFLNLLINAAHAIEGKGTIIVRTGYDEKVVWVEIEDNGSGIAPAHLDHIFEPFFTTKPVGKGTGLGLSIVYGIVQGHRGTIDVRSEVGRGTTFRVALPRVA